MDNNILSAGFLSYFPNEIILYSTESNLNNKTVTVCINNERNNKVKCYHMNGRDFQKTEKGNDGYNSINSDLLLKYSYKKNCMITIMVCFLLLFMTKTIR